MKRRHLVTGMLILTLLTACTGPRIKLFTDATDPLREFTIEGSGSDRILLIPIRGVISDNPKKGLLSSSPSMVQQVVSQLRKAEQDRRVKAVLLKINSPGGSITASDLLYHEIAAYKARTKAKVIVCMMDMAASGGYYLSLPADMIMAHPTSLTGSVGVIFLQPKVMGLMDKLGLGLDVKKYGKNKDMGSPFRESTEEEQKFFQITINQLGDRFTSLVRKHRNLDPQSLAEMSTARLFLSEEAFKLGLIDKIGYLNDAVSETKLLAGLPGDARVVLYRRDEQPEDNLYSISGVTANDPRFSFINVELPESLNLITGFYYIWPGAIGGYR